jgi:hypothetical protein
MSFQILRSTALILVLAAAACSQRPGEDELRASFAQQLASNKFVKGFERSGDDLRFTGPGAEGGEAQWRVHIDSAVVEPNDDQAQPYKGTVKSSWYSDGQPIVPSGRDSGLPFELMSNGLSQECWAFWDSASRQWNWE